MQHARVLAPIVSLGFLVVACDGGGTTFTAIDAPPPDGPVDAAVDALVPSATYTYVVSAIRLPTTANEATQLGLDVDDLAGDPNGGIDNALGSFLGSLTGISPGLDVPGATTSAIDRGESLLLARLGANELMAPGPATLTFDVGANPLPAACASPADPVCRRHFSGDASFTLVGGGTPVIGEVIGSSFAGDGGTFVLPIVFSDGGPVAYVPVVLGASQVQVSTTGLVSGKLGGAIRQADIESTLHPGLQLGLSVVVDRDCAGQRTPPDCGCVSGSTGLSLLGFLDTATPRDCQISVAEVTSTLNSLLTTDIDTNGDGQNDAVSIGVGYTAVPATIRP